jgi:hypothetical protein
MKVSEFVQTAVGLPSAKLGPKPTPGLERWVESHIVGTLVNGENEGALREQ